MMSGDEFYDDDVTSGFDPYARADFLRDYYEDHFPCRTCGSPDPAIIEKRWCSDCTGENAEAFERTRAARLDWMADLPGVVIANEASDAGER